MVKFGHRFSELVTQLFVEALVCNFAFSKREKSDVPRTFRSFKHLGILASPVHQRERHREPLFAKKRKKIQFKLNLFVRSQVSAIDPEKIPVRTSLDETI